MSENAERILEGLNDAIARVCAEGADVNGVVTGYMCMIDWEYELGYASDGNRVYPSVEALKRAHKGWESCGIVRVEVRAVAVEAPQRLGLDQLDAAV